jgi:hypothetical protein
MGRWLIASIAEHFRGVAADHVDFMIEDEVRDTANLSSWVELRINGPEYKEWSSGSYMIDLEVDLLINVRHDPTNIYHIHDLSGLFESNCDDIPIYKYGHDDSFLFCLPLDPQMVSNIKKMYYGKAPDTPIKRVSIMAFYEVLTTL